MASSIEADIYLISSIHQLVLAASYHKFSKAERLRVCVIFNRSIHESTPKIVSLAKHLGFHVIDLTSSCWKLHRITKSFFKFNKFDKSRNRAELSSLTTFIQQHFEGMEINQVFSRKVRPNEAFLISNIFHKKSIIF